MKYLKAGKI